MAWLKKLIGLPPGENLVWWLIGKQRNIQSQIFAFIGFIAIFWIAYQNPWAAIAMMMAMYFHELGHFIIFSLNKIKSTVLLLFPLGAVAAPVNKEEDVRSDLLPWWHIGWLLQAGPTMNAILMFIGLILVRINLLPLLGGQLIYINGLLCLFNLLPLVNMDGGQLFHVIFSSLKEKHETVLAVLSVVLSSLVIWIVLFSPAGLSVIGVLKSLFYNSGLILFLLLMSAGIWHKQGKDKPLHAVSTQAMTVRQVVIQLGYYVSLLIISFILFSL